MYVYTPGQWALLFFFYCFCGWVWESCYVSAKQRHWVNRGFLHGPLLPIYGSGAIIILFATLPVDVYKRQELERISKTACSQPSRPSEPKMTPGRFRTRSAPFRDEMLSLP